MAGVVGLFAAGGRARAQSITADMASSGRAQGAGTFVLFRHTTSARSARYLVVGLATSERAPALLLTYGNQLFRRLGDRGTADPMGCSLELFGLVAPATGAHDVVASFASNAGFILAVGVGFAGVDGAAPIGGFAANDGTENAATVALTAVPGDLLVDVLCVTGPRVPVATADPGQVPLLVGAHGDVMVATSTRQGGGTPRWTFQPGISAQWVLAALALRPATRALPDAGGTDADGADAGGSDPDSAPGSTDADGRTDADGTDAAGADGSDGSDAAGTDGRGTGSGGSTRASYRVGCACRLNPHGARAPLLLLFPFAALVLRRSSGPAHRG